jgi:hypothetical protein
MDNSPDKSKKPPEFLDVVALLYELPEKSLVSGQVGTIVEVLDSANLLVKFSDEGRAYAIIPIPKLQHAQNF